MKRPRHDLVQVLAQTGWSTRTFTVTIIIPHYSMALAAMALAGNPPGRGSEHFSEAGSGDTGWSNMTGTAPLPLSGPMNPRCSSTTQLAARSNGLEWSRSPWTLPIYACCHSIITNCALAHTLVSCLS